MWVTRQITTHTGTHRPAYQLPIDRLVMVHRVCILLMDLKRSMTLFLADDPRGREETAAEKSYV